MTSGPVPLPAGSEVGAREVLTGWSLDVPMAVLVVAGGAAYFGAAIRVRRRGGRWPGGRLGAFAAGLVAVVAATQTGLATYDETLFSAHVAQHVLLGMVAPALLALAAPVTLALRVAPVRTGRRLAAVARSRPAGVLTHPVAGWSLFVTSPFVLYFTPLYGLTLRHEMAHVLAHVALVLAGTAFLAPVVGRDPARWRAPHGLRVLALALSLPFHAFLGVALMSSSRPTLSATGLADQQRGGALLWLAGDVVAVVLLGVAVGRWVRSEERAAKDEDAVLAGPHRAPQRTGPGGTYWG